jgi:acetylornithine deacetylase/succinyl-diaminopimelate desuccinylase-like protein
MLRALVAFGLVLTSLARASAEEKQEKVVSPAPSIARPEFPLVVRIDDKALDPLRAKDVRHQGRVNRMVLGTRAIGTSETTGATKVSIIPDRDDAAFTIRFHGETHTRTSGSNHPQPHLHRI